MKSIHKISAILFVCLFLLLPVSVYGDTYGVYDTYGLLDGEQKEELNQRLSKIRDAYGFDGVLLITGNMGEEKDYRMYAAEYMQECDIGYGEEKNGMCFWHQPDVRNVTLVFRGPYQDLFDADIQDIMLDHCTEKLKEASIFDAYSILLDDLEQGLERAVQGKTIRPMDLESVSVPGEILKYLSLSFFIAAVPTLLMTLYQRSRMKTKIPQSNADSYIPDGGLEIQRANDIYLRTVTTKAPIPKSEGTGDGGGGSFSSGGESFSGSSRNY